MTSVYTTIEYYYYRPLYATTIFLASELVYRSFLLTNEIRYYSRHHPVRNRYFSILSTVFKFNRATILYFYLTLTLLACAAMKDPDIVVNILNQCSLAPIYLLIRYIRVSYGGIEEATWIRSGNGLDYASGMASNYFHGYLNLQLPHRGDNIKGIRERIRDYEDKHDVKFAINKLVIIVPDSLHSPPTVNSRVLEKVACLETVVKGRAGVDRPFKNDVYRFKKKINNKHYYISLEGATPLLSFKEAMTHDLTSTPEMKAMQREILIQFHHCLKKFIRENPDTRNECEIVIFPDSGDNDEQHDVGLYLMKYISKLIEFNN